TEGKIATNAVTEGKIATNAVTEGKIATNAVTEGKIETNAVTEGKIETNAVTEGKIATNAVTEGKIATNAVTAAKLDSTVQSRLLPTTEIFTFAPSLFPNSGATPWLQNNGIATNDPNRSDASGWLPLQLPDGLVIQSVTVFGTKIGNFNFRITLQQQPLTGTGNSVILFGKQLSPVPDGAFSNLALDLQAGVSTAINNKNSKYFITLLIPSITAPATASIYAIQVSLARP
ncbi:hypothetical protein ACN4EK_06035, partial [Pantanalinema rosaneae CENA516]|uniref:hypothetical protein n=1 Tax=Pantanalinema rosaneae TaxID=1620701 RepID=UPI003D6E785D